MIQLLTGLGCSFKYEPLVRICRQQSKSTGGDRESNQVVTRILQHPHEGNDRFFNFAVSLRSAGMSLNDIELTLRDEASFGRSVHQRRAQIPIIMSVLKRSFKKSA